MYSIEILFVLLALFVYLWLKSFNFNDYDTVILTKEGKIMNLKFSIVTATLNSENSIIKTIESILKQSYKPYQYIIYDGCSTDETISIAESYRRNFEKNGILYSIISEHDTGIYNAFNKGIIKATGDFISFIGAGDWYELDALENINAFYNQEAFDLTYGGIHYISGNGKCINKMSKLDKYYISSRNWNHPSMFLKTNIQKENLFNEKYSILGDFDLYLRLRKKNIKIRVIDKVIANFPAGTGISTSTTLKNVLRRAKEKYYIYKNNGYSFLYIFECYGWDFINK